MRLPLAACGLAAGCLVLLALAGPLYRLGLPLPAAFGLMRWAAYGGVAAFVLSLGVLAWMYRRRQRWGMAAAALGLVLSLVAIGVPYSWQRAATRNPPIHDISTDLLNRPAFDAVVPLRKDAPNDLTPGPDVADQQRRGYPDIQPVTLPLQPGPAFDRGLAVAQEMDWEIVSADKSAGRIEATATTRWFGFKDDVVVRFTPWGGGTRADVRSVSRIGAGDAGTNARRIEEFLERVGVR